MKANPTRTDYPKLIGDELTFRKNGESQTYPITAAYCIVSTMYLEYNGTKLILDTHELAQLLMGLKIKKEDSKITLKCIEKQ